MATRFHPRAWIHAFVASLLLIGALAAFAPVAVSATSGYDRVNDPAINPLIGGGYRVAVAAYATFDPSVGIVAAPHPSIDWGEGTSSNASVQFCSSRTVTSGVNITTSCSGGDLSGEHVYANYGAYHIRLRYYTGCCVSYDATWDVTIPRTTDAINLSTTGTGSGVITYSLAANDGGTVCPPNCTPRFPAGTVVTLTPTANAWSAFGNYVGTLCGKGGCHSPCSANPCTLTMPEDYGYATDVKVSFTRTDTTPPVITASARTTGDNRPYTAGTWTNQSVQVGFSCADGGVNPSGVATNTVAGATVSAEGANQSVTNTGTCMDNAGNTANAVTFSPIKIDMTKPAITGSVVKADTTPYTPNTWINQSVTVAFSCADTGTVQSGIGTNTVAGATISADTASQSVTNTGVCVDNAGNAAASATVGPIKVDTIKSVITDKATTADGKSYTAGTWTNQNVTVAFTCADGGSAPSGVATNTLAGATINSEGANLSVTNTGACTDNAGNSADPVTFGPIKINKTPPTVTGAITPGSIWPPNHKFVPITATVNVGDSASGAANFVLVSATASGDASDIQGFTVGQASTSGQVRANKDEVYTLTYRGMDNAGNSATLVLTVKVPHDQRS